jgi:hypothetical protein
MYVLDRRHTWAGDPIKNPTNEDNWAHCRVHVDTASEYLVNSHCLYDDGHAEAKWREARRQCAHRPDRRPETDAVIVMQFCESESGDSDDDEDCDVCEGCTAASLHNTTC